MGTRDGGAGVRPPGGRGSTRLRALDRTVGVTALTALARIRRRRSRPDALRRVGLMKTTGIGDMVLLSAIARDTMQALPSAEVVIVAGAENAAVARLVDGARVVHVPAAAPHRVVPLLRREHFDALLDFGQWARVEALYAALSGARWTAGFATAGQRRHAAYDVPIAHREDVHELDNFRALASALDVESASTPRIAPAGSPAGLVPDGSYVVFHLWPGGFRSHLREWPLERWRALAEGVAACGHTVLLTGGPGDRRRAEAFARSCDAPVTSIAGCCGLAELVGVLAGAECVVSVNTGVMHLAAAAGTRTVALNGPTSSLRWGPVGDRVVNVDSALPQCGFLNLGFEYDGRREDCMRGITVDRVAAAALLAAEV